MLPFEVGQDDVPLLAVTADTMLSFSTANTAIGGTNRDLWYLVFHVFQPPQAIGRFREALDWSPPRDALSRRLEFRVLRDEIVIRLPER